MLVITAAPDERPSTRNLSLILDEVNRRPDARATLWYLRSAPEHVERPGTRVVDSLRTWPPCAALDAVGLAKPAAWIRGRRLRGWLREVDPDVVVLDDGLGARVLDPLSPRPPVVVRRNAVTPEHQHLEPPPEESADLLVVPAGTEAEDTDVPTLVEHTYGHAYGSHFASAEERGAIRERYDLPTAGPLLVGWGDDGWLDGPDLFIRTMWALAERHGVEIDGVWFGLTADADEVDRLRREAERCGVGDRFHHRPAVSTALRLCGDAVLVPYRTVATADDVVVPALAGCVVVAFEATGVEDPDVTLVPDLDVEAAAAALAEGLRQDRAEREAQRHWRLDPRLLVDGVLDLAGARRR